MPMYHCTVPSNCYCHFRYLLSHILAVSLVVYSPRQYPHRPLVIYLVLVPISTSLLLIIVVVVGCRCPQSWSASSSSLIIDCCVWHSTLVAARSQQFNMTTCDQLNMTSCVIFCHIYHLIPFLNAT